MPLTLRFRGPARGINIKYHCDELRISIRDVTPGNDQDYVYNVSRPGLYEFTDNSPNATENKLIIYAGCQEPFEESDDFYCRDPNATTEPTTTTTSSTTSCGPEAPNGNECIDLCKEQGLARLSYSRNEDANGCVNQCVCGISTTARPTTTAIGYRCQDDTNCAAAGCQDDNAGPTPCTRCGNGYYLSSSTGECVAECSADEVPVGESNGDEGRTCQQGPEYECVASEGCISPVDELGNCTSSLLRPVGQAPRCVKCADDQYLYMVNNITRCNPTLTCGGDNFEELPTDANFPCDCSGSAADSDTCYRCTFSGGSIDSAVADVTCLSCRMSLYFSNGLCLEGNECPAPTVPSGQGVFDRKCLEPHKCTSSTIDDGPNAGMSCRCSKSCRSCEYTATGTGYACLECRSKQYLLLDGYCGAECDADQASVGTGSLGRYCAASEVTCDRGTSSNDGRSCDCPANCDICVYGIGGSPGTATCNQCAQGYTLDEATGDCVV